MSETPTTRRAENHWTHFTGLAPIVAALAFLSFFLIHIPAAQSASILEEVLETPPRPRVQSDSNINLVNKDDRFYGTSKSPNISFESYLDKDLITHVNITTDQKKFSAEFSKSGSISSIKGVWLVGGVAPFDQADQESLKTLAYSLKSLLIPNSAVTINFSVFLGWLVSQAPPGEPIDATFTIRPQSGETDHQVDSATPTADAPTCPNGVCCVDDFLESKYYPTWDINVASNSLLLKTYGFSIFPALGFNRICWFDSATHHQYEDLCDKIGTDIAVTYSPTYLAKTEKLPEKVRVGEVGSTITYPTTDTVGDCLGRTGPGCSGTSDLWFENGRHNNYTVEALRHDVCTGVSNDIFMGDDGGCVDEYLYAKYGYLHGEDCSGAESNTTPPDDVVGYWKIEAPANLPTYATSIELTSDWKIKKDGLEVGLYYLNPANSSDPVIQLYLYSDGSDSDRILDVTCTKHIYSSVVAGMCVSSSDPTRRELLGLTRSTLGVITGTVTNKTQTGVTLNGTVNPNGLSTTVKFRYGTTTSYDKTTTSVTLTAGNTDQPVTADVTGLTCGTTYHFMVKAYNTDGIKNGLDASFTTPGCNAPVVTTDPATNKTTTGVTLNGTVNPKKDSTTWKFKYGTTTSYGLETASVTLTAGNTDQPVTADVTGLTCGTKYHFQVWAKNTSGTTKGSDATFTTSSCSTTGTSPTATTGAVTNKTQTTVTLNGTVNPNGLSTTVKFQYGTITSHDSNTSSVTLTGSTDQAVTADLTGLTCGTTYLFRVWAKNTSGTTKGSDATFTTSACATPTATTSSATNITTTGATLNGTVNPNNESTTVKFQYGTTTSYGSNTTSQTLTGSTDQPVTADVTGLTCGTKYHFRVWAKNTSGTTKGSDATFTTSACATPTATTGSATNVTTTGATLNGTVNPNNESTTVKFQYGTTTSYGKTTTSETLTAGNTSQTVSATLTTLTCGKKYHFQVWAKNTSGTTKGSDGTFTTSSCSSTTLLVSATAGTGGSVTPTSRSVTSGSTAAFTVTANSGYTTNTSVGGTCAMGSWSGTTYTTGAVTAACSVSFSFTQSTGGAPSAPTGVSATAGNGQASVSWSASAGATSYNVYYRTTAGVTKSNGTKVTGATSGGSITGLTNGTAYYFVVTAKNSAGESGVSSEVSATPTSGATTPSTPTGVSATAGNGQATVSWSASANATSYNVYYRTTAGVTKSNGTKVTGATSGGAITGLTNGTAYYYAVTAQNSAGESGVSSEVSATPTAGGGGNTAPTASINSPSDGSSYSQGNSISFSGSGYDTEDGNLTGGSLVWSSNINGQIGTGSSFSRSDLAAGTHVITLTATDSKGATGFKIVSIAVNSTSNGQITVGPSSFDFGSVNVGSCSSTAYFAIQHVSGTLAVSGTVGASPNPPFSISSGSSFSASNGQGVNVGVQFCPSSGGAFNGSATVYSSATFTGTNTVTLSGTGVSAVVNPYISSVSPNPVTGSNSSQSFTIYGSNFVSGANVTLRDLSTGEIFSNRSSSYFSSTQITLNPNFTTAAHTWSVEVINPDGRSSGQYTFSVR